MPKATFFTILVVISIVFSGCSLFSTNTEQENIPNEAPQRPQAFSNTRFSQIDTARSIPNDILRDDTITEEQTPDDEPEIAGDEKEVDSTSAADTATPEEKEMGTGELVDKPVPDEETLPEPKPQPTYTGAVLAGNTTKIIDFNQSDYETAVANQETVVLYFYANWCPICRHEVATALYPAFNELSDPDVIGFRVNYNDSETDNNEEALAKKFGVAYQHTKVILKNNERILKSPTSWSKEEYLTQITNLAQ